MSTTPNPSILEADPKRPWKAYVSAGVAGAIAFATYWIADVDPFTAKEAAEAGIAALIASGLTGGATFLKGNPPRPSAP